MFRHSTATGAQHSSEERFLRVLDRRSQALIVVARAAAVGLLSATEQSAWLHQYLSAQSATGWAVTSNEDAALMLEALVAVMPLVTLPPTMHVMRSALSVLSEQLFGAWNGTCCLSRNPGGNWDDSVAHSGKTVVANAGAAVAFAALFAAEWNLTFAERANLLFEYWRLNLMQDSGQVTAGVSFSGIANTGIATLNEGLIIGAAAGLGATNSEYFAFAESPLKFLLENEVVSTTGVLREQQPCAETNLECQVGKGIAYRHLTTYAATGYVSAMDAALTRTLSASVEAIWANVDGTVMPINWESKGGAATLAGQASALSAVVAWTGLVCGSATTDPATTSPAPSGFVATWQAVMTILMSIVIGLVVLGVVAVACLRRRARRLAAAARGDTSVTDMGFATDDEEADMILHGL
jgi:hypothetical protein